MGLIKLIILVALAFAVVAVWRRVKALQTARRSADTAGAPEPMVRCNHCQIHLPRAQAIQGSDQHWFCCDEHRDTHRHG